jgi:trypsin
MIKSLQYLPYLDSLLTNILTALEKMRNFVAIFFTFLPIISQISARGNQQIVNGIASEIQPFMVSIRHLQMDADRFGSGHMCGGTILTRNLILTTASCLIDQNNHFLEISDILIIAGTNRRYEDINAVSVFPRMISIHPNHVVNNVALIETWTMPQNSRNIHPINMTLQPPIPGDFCEIYGFGHALSLNGPSQLQRGTIQVVDRSACHSHRTDNICSSGSTFPCHGDAGGGLICDGQLAGIIDNLDADFCRTADDVMSVSYIGVGIYRNWIVEHMRRIEMDLEVGDPNEGVGMGATRFWMIFVNSLVILVWKFQ